MDNSKVNQTELNYNCDAGQAKLNLFTGRLIFNHFDGSTGSDSYRINISHIYNSQMVLPSDINTYIGEKWKLNIQQYLYFQNDKYFYIDENGMSYTFESYDSGRYYYDTSGLGLILEVINNHFVIKDQEDNEMIFENKHLVKRVSGYNSEIVQNFIYDSSDKLVSVYDSRMNDYKFVFEYNDQNLLTNITTKEVEAKKFNLIFEYDNLNNVKKIDYKMNGIVTESVLFQYLEHKMVYAALVSNKTALRFEYSNDKVVDVCKGIAVINRIKSSTFKEQNYLNSEIVCGDDKFTGERLYNTNYNIENMIPDENVLNKNIINYEGNSTSVENEKGLKLIYYFNQNGYTTSILEANNGNIFDLRTLEKDPGRSMISSGSDTECINTKQAYLLATNYVMTTENIMADCLNNVDLYRGKKCANYYDFICAFWLKINQPLSSKKIKLIIKDTKELVDDGVFNTATIDNSAISSWQRVTIPIRIPFNEIKYIELSFEDNDAMKQIKIADMRICHNNPTKLYLTDGTSLWEPLENVEEIKYIPITNPEEQRTLHISEDLYITEKDLQMMYLSKFKSLENEPSNQDYLMSFCNGTKKMLVKGITLCTSTNDFIMSFGTDDYGVGTRAKYFYEMKSQNENACNYGLFHYIRNKEINGIYYDCICQINESNNDNMKSHTEIYLDLFGNLLMEQDEYGVQTIYTYDEYNMPNKKIIKHPNTNETIVFINSYNKNKRKVENSTSYINYYYNNIFGRIDKIDYRGENELEENELITNNYYNDYTGRLKKISNNLGSSNYIKYSSDGKVLQVLPTNYNSENMYGYQYGYDLFGNPSNYYYMYRSAEGIEKKILLEKSIDLLNGKINIKYHRSNSEVDEVEIVLDKYGRTKTINDNSKITTFQKQTLWESEGASEITEMYDPYEEVTHEYDYDFFNNLTNYRIKKDNDEILNIIKSSPTKTKYEYDENSYMIKSHETDVKYDDTKFIKPRINETVDAYDSFLGLEGIDYGPHLKSNYNYDSLGRISDKTHGAYDSSIIPFEENKKEYMYKYGTFLKNRITYDISGQETTARSYQFDYVYNTRGNISTRRLKYNGVDIESYNKEYTYDKANRLTRERDIEQNTTTEYSYNDDGTISSIEDTNDRLNYVYNGGRLIEVNKASNPNGKKFFSYDDFGNCINFDGAILTWERGNLLSKYVKENDEINYSYNNKGIIIKKQKNNITHSYLYENGKLLIEKNSNTILEYIYDKDEIIGFIVYENHKCTGVYYYIKDVTGNVIAITSNNQEIARYSYDAWGKTVIEYNNGNGIAELNPIRWKSQYYDSDIKMYYISGKFYSPSINQFITAENIESTLNNIYTLDSLNLYTINVENPINLVYNENTIFENCSIQYDPPELSGFVRYWRTKSGEESSIGLALAAAILCISTGGLALLGGFIALVASSFAVGMAIAGLISMSEGNSVLRGFENFLNENWSQILAITSIVAIATIGIQTISYAISNAKFPPNNGAVPGTEKVIDLQPGTYGRYGKIVETSKYITDVGVKPSQLSLPPWNNRVYTEITVLKPIPNVVQSTVAPWIPWGGVGGGVQYMFNDTSIVALKNLGYLIY